jgi:hypothetical protein
MSKTKEEPYTVITVRRNGEVKYKWSPRDGGGIVRVGDGTWWFDIYYRNYTRMQHIRIEAKDELEAFMLGQQRLNKTKKHYDNYGKRRSK